MQATIAKLHSPQCYEYCKGTPAEYYCPECAAMFCDSCYNKEHGGNKRKSLHGKLAQLRSVCDIHKHTLEYFNMTLFQPICMICRKDIAQNPEFSHHVVYDMETITPKLKTILRDKLDSATKVAEKLNKEVTIVENSAKSSREAAIMEAHGILKLMQNHICQRESEIEKGANKCVEEFLEVNGELAEAKNTLENLQAVMNEGENFLKEESISIGVKFAALNKRLEELCTVASQQMHLKRLKITVDNENVLSILEQLRQVVQFFTITYFSQESDEGSESSQTTESASGTNSDIESMQTDLDGEEIQPSDNTENLLVTNIKIELLQTNQERVMKRQLTEPVRPPPCKHARSSKITPNKSSTKRPRKKRMASPSTRRTQKPKGAARSPRTSHSPCKNASANSPSMSGSCSRVKRGGELSKEIGKCDVILTELWAREESFPFARAVDRNQVGNYYDVIKEPMDLSQIKKNMYSVTYASAIDFVRDIRLMFNNCRTYNQKGSFVYEAGEKLEEIFNSLLQRYFPNFQDAFLESCAEDCGK